MSKRVNNKTSKPKRNKEYAHETKLRGGAEKTIYVAINKKTRRAQKLRILAAFNLNVQEEIEKAL